MVLYVTADVKDIKDSRSLYVGGEFINAYKALHPTEEVVHLDLFKDEPAYLDGALIGCMFGQIAENDLDETHKKQWQKLQSNLNQFMNADKFVIATPLWNLSVPHTVKGYIDNITIAGKTFKYTATGPVGLMNGKKALCIQSSGGVYSSGPAAAFEHGLSYVKSLLTFLGCNVVDVIVTEGTDVMGADIEKIKADAAHKAKEIAKTF